MRPKGKLFALVVLFAAVGLLTATGAFTTVEADRTADIDVTGDSNALLALEPANNSEFATVENNGQVVIELNSSNVQNGAGGVNTNASTMDDNVLNITNNGQEDVQVSVTTNTPSDDATVVFYNATAENGVNDTSTDTVDDLANTPQHTTNVDSFDTRYTLNDTALHINSGDTEMIGIYIETYGMTNSSSSQVLDEVTITAEEES